MVFAAHFGSLQAPTPQKLEAEMFKLARNLEFEEAALLRDQIQKLRQETFGVPDEHAA
jgi:excinuclease UvrABC helicase subunit UvrB